MSEQNSAVITALETNIFVAVWDGDEPTSDFVSDILDRANAQGRLVISPPVYAELVAAPGRDRAFVERFLQETTIDVDWLLSRQVWESAALAFRAYAERRRTQAGDPGPRRILADFIIGAHALHHSSSLLTFDQRIYRVAFPTLNVVVPTM
jgi:predicted nucleic acid-binding protein